MSQNSNTVAEIGDKYVLVSAFIWWGGAETNTKFVLISVYISQRVAELNLTIVYDCIHECVSCLHQWQFCIDECIFEHVKYTHRS